MNKLRRERFGEIFREGEIQTKITIMKFKLIQETPWEFEKAVSRMINEGWELRGQMIHYVDNQGIVYILQQMILFDLSHLDMPTATLLRPEGQRPS